jgi:hypothetical protein
MAERQDTGGLTTLLQVLGARGGLVGDDGNQVDLFEAEDAPLPLPTKGRSGPQGGRPINAVSKSTEAWARYMLSQHRSPLTVLANIMGQDLAELHGTLQDLADKRATVRVGEDGREHLVGAVRVDPLQVLKLQKDAAVALAPYVHKQQPKALEIADRPRGVMIMGDLVSSDVADEAEDALELPLAPIVEKQQVSGPARAQSDTTQSDTGESASKNNPLAYNGD